MVQRITIDSQQCEGSVLALKADQMHYLSRVLRLKAGDRFIAQDGQGQQWLAALSDQPDQAQIVEQIAQTSDFAKALPLRLIAALPKGNSFDQVVRQSTELGVTHIYPVMSDRSLLRPSPHKLARWQRIAQEAAEQSERVNVPEIFAPTDFRACLAQRDQISLKTDFCYLCAARTESPHLLKQVMADLTSANLRGVTLAIGPEGGWTSDEIAVALKCGYEVVSLGSVILRAVTAPVAALSLVTAVRELLI
jgi:16S rRNA (uracil1498-N3)-methyltransferase